MFSQDMGRSFLYPLVFIGFIKVSLCGYKTISQTERARFPSSSRESEVEIERVFLAGENDACFISARAYLAISSADPNALNTSSLFFGEYIFLPLNDIVAISSISLN